MELIKLTKFGKLAKSMSNPCIRCGKQRVDGKTWNGKVGASAITYTQTLCPDPTCQKIVEKGIADRKAKSALLSKEKIEAKLARAKLLSAN